MSEYVFYVSGCDDHTVLIVEMTPEQAAFVAQLANRVKAAKKGVTCKPTMDVFTMDSKDGKYYVQELEDDEKWRKEWGE